MVEKSPHIVRFSHYDGHDTILVATNALFMIPRVHSIALRRGTRRHQPASNAQYILAPELLSQMTLVIVQVLHQLYSLANGGGVAVFLGSIQPHESLSTWQMIFFPLLFNT